MASRERLDSDVQYLRWLAQAGLSDVLTLRRDTAARVLSEKRMELIREIADGDVESVRGLARRVGRDVSIVSRDLDVLYEAAVVEFDRDGAAKRPYLTHENVFVTPVVFEGAVLDE